MLIWACRVRGEPAGEDRPGGGPAAGAVRGGFWGLLVSEVVRGLKVPMGWSEGRDWALATRLAGESFRGGRNEELGCRGKKKDVVERGLAVGTLGANFPEAGHHAKSGRRHKQRFSNGAEAEPQFCSGNQPPGSQLSRPNESSLQPTGLLLGRQKRQSPWGALVPGVSSWGIDSQVPGRPLGGSPPSAAGLPGESGSEAVAPMSPTQGPRRRKKPCGAPLRGPQSHVSMEGGSRPPPPGLGIGFQRNPNPVLAARAPQRSPSTCS